MSYDPPPQASSKSFLKRCFPNPQSYCHNGLHSHLQSWVGLGWCGVGWGGVGWGRAGQGRAGQGRARQGTIGQCWARQGRSCSREKTLGSVRFGIHISPYCASRKVGPLGRFKAGRFKSVTDWPKGRPLILRFVCYLRKKIRSALRTPLVMTTQTAEAR